MNNTFEKVPIPFESFESLLNENSKILFSGVFGSGKTTFLKDYFLDKKDLLSIHIYPVNYSVASNEDIFELIKYDILFQLIGKMPKDKFEDIDIPYELILWHYIISSNNLEDKIDFFASFLNFAGKYGRGLLNIYDKFKILKSGYDEYYDKIKKDELKDITAILESRTKSKGDIYEEDFFTELIRNLISKLIEIKEFKTSVLIIDDLDRLDPDHIFRILNIFSAHIDFNGKNSDNKFDFNKVVLVCDNNNIRNIFHHKYGYDSDYKGYIDKFYTNIYWHNPNNLIKIIIGNYLSTIKTEVEYDLFNNSSEIGQHIRLIFIELLDFNLINFRDLINYNKNFKILNKYNFNHIMVKNSLLKNYLVPTEIIINFLRDFYNNDGELVRVIGKAKIIEERSDSNRPDSNINIIGDLLLFINHYKLGRFKSSKEEQKTLTFKDYKFECIIHPKMRELNLEIVSIEKNGQKILNDEMNYFQFLEEAINVYMEYVR